MIDRDRRRHERVQIKRNVTVRNGAESHEGALVDISSSGAAISIEEDNYTIEEDQDLELDMEDFGVLTGNVVRTLDEGFAMTFDLDESSEDRLITELTGYRSGGFTD